MTPPMSVTTAVTFGKIGAHAGEVIGQTSTSPSRTSASSLDVDHDPRRALDDARRRGRAREPRAALVRARPLLHALRRDAPEHDRHRVGDRLGRDADRGRRRPLGEPLEQLLAPGDDRRPVARPGRRTAGRPGEQQLVERLRDLVPRRGGTCPRGRRGSRGPRAARRTRAACSTSGSGTSSRSRTCAPRRTGRPCARARAARGTSRGRPRRAARRTPRPAGRARGRSPRSAARPRSPAFSARMWPTTEAYGMLGSSYQLP